MVLSQLLFVHVLYSRYKVTPNTVYWDLSVTHWIMTQMYESMKTNLCLYNSYTEGADIALKCDANVRVWRGIHRIYQTLHNYLIRPVSASQNWTSGRMEIGISLVHVYLWKKFAQVIFLLWPGFTTHALSVVCASQAVAYLTCDFQCLALCNMRISCQVWDKFGINDDLWSFYYASYFC